MTYPGRHTKGVSWPVRVLAVLVVIAIAVSTAVFLPDLFSHAPVILHAQHIANGYVPRTPRIMTPVPHAAHVVPHHAMQRLYTVRNGDTLWSVAFRLYHNGTGWARLYALNRIAIGSNPNLIHTGLELRY